MKTRRIVFAALLLAAVSAGTGQAADEGPQYEGIPSYSVTRLKISEGSVWVRTPDSGEWEEFQNNSPVPERARISVPDDSEAELQFHGGQYMLLTGGTDLDLDRLEDGISVFRFRSGEIRFDLPEDDFSPVRVLVSDDARVDLPVPGKYWLTAPENEDPGVVVRAGEATVTTGRGESTVRRGEEARIGRDVRVGPYAGGPVEERREETRLSDEESQAGVPPSAAVELRDYGEWVHSSEYGYVWRPRVAPGWTPYYYGQWVWISPYGWTWISSEPWGWYPYHYGYWYTDPIFGWVWYPFHSFVSVSFVFGNVSFHHFHRRAFFVPATVRFVGRGSTVRWVPLRPGERVRRVRFTRADRRLAGRARPLPARTVYVRRQTPKGRVWTDWNAVRTGTRTVGKPPAPVRRVGPAPKPDRGQEGIRGRTSPPNRSGVRSQRGRFREQAEPPPARRIERMERPTPESRPAPGGRIAPVPRDENRASRPEPSVGRPIRAIPESEPAGRRESLQDGRPGGDSVRDRSDVQGGGWDRGGGSRVVR
jgi:Family of unknown function (DUF6600)